MQGGQTAQTMCNENTVFIYFINLFTHLLFPDLQFWRGRWVKSEYFQADMFLLGFFLNPWKPVFFRAGRITMHHNHLSHLHFAFIYFNARLEERRVGKG